MGTIGLAGLGLMLGHAAAAGAAQLSIYAPNGPAGPGDATEIVVVVHNKGTPISAPAPQVRVDGAVVSQAPAEVAPGRWLFELPTADAKTRRIDIAHGRATLSRVLGPARLPGARLKAPARVDANLGDTIAFDIFPARATPPEAQDIAVLGTDGQLVGVVPNDQDGLTVKWQPGDSPFPRVLALGVVDLRAPQVPPVWVVAGLRGRPQIPIQTEAGARVTVSVGGRVTESVVADEDGRAVVRPEVRPGETRAKVLTEDALGNTQRSEIALGGDARPVLTVVPSGSIVPGRPMPHLHVHASRAGGRPWEGEAPSCMSSRGGTLPLAALGPGKWRAQLPASLGNLDAQIHCDLSGRVQTRTQVSVETGLPTRLTLRAHPSAITADLPSAEIQAFLENSLGDRLPSQGIRLKAARGSVERVEGDTPALVRAVYRGDRAVSMGSDTIQADASLPLGTGGVGSLDLQVSAPQGRQSILIDARALDRQGRPLQNKVLQLRLGAVTMQTTTGARGWGSVEVPWPKRSDVVIAEASAWGLVRREAVLPGDAVVRDISGPDLTAELSLAVLPGRISGIRLVATPRVVEVGGQPAEVEVHLEDRAGKRVLNQTVELKADKGSLSTVTQHTDGRFTALYTPPNNLLAGDARIEARTTDERFTASVDVAIVPPRLREALGIAVGGLTSSGTDLSPYGAIEYDRRLPWAPFVFRGSVGFTSRTAVDEDASSSSAARVNLQTIPVTAGVLLRQDGALFPRWAGLTLVGGVHLISSELAGEKVGESIQVAPPGFQLVTGTGWRLARGELQAQLGYLFIYGAPGPVAWEGPVGGVVGSLGYKVLY